MISSTTLLKVYDFSTVNIIQISQYQRLTLHGLHSISLATHIRAINLNKIIHLFIDTVAMPGNMNSSMSSSNVKGFCAKKGVRFTDSSN